jgi:hypothetical protein
MGNAFLLIVWLAVVIGGLLLSNVAISIERQIMHHIHEANKHAPRRYAYRNSNGSTVYLTKEQHRRLQASRFGRMAPGVRLG